MTQVNDKNINWRLLGHSLFRATIWAVGTFFVLLMPLSIAMLIEAVKNDIAIHSFDFLNVACSGLAKCGLPLASVAVSSSPTIEICADPNRNLEVHGLKWVTYIIGPLIVVLLGIVVFCSDWQMSQAGQLSINYTSLAFGLAAAIFSLTTGALSKASTYYAEGNR